MRWILVLALLASPGAFSQEVPEWFVESFLDIGEDAAEAAKDGKRLMLYFMQDGCPYCKQLVTVNFKEPRIVEKVRRNFMPVAINIWGDREVTGADGRKMPEKRYAAALKVQFTPTLVFFDEKGAVAHRINGYLPPEEFYAALERALAPQPPRARATLGLGASQGVRPSPASPASSASVSGLAASRSSSACSRSTWRCSSVDISAAKARTASARAFAATSL
jgi:thioredoxin-related protein